MPGWHAKTKQLVKDGKLAVLGIAPEQHGDRMALFLQWKNMRDMPVLLDSYNLYGLKVVPITLLIDETGVVRYKNPNPADLEAFLDASPPPVRELPPAPRLKTILTPEGMFSRDHTVLLATAKTCDALLGQERFAKNPALHFQRGVLYRKLHDTKGEALPGGQRATFFKEAVTSWRTALALDPSNYIWRRRLQQYGPRLDKPYPFYDWIAQARQELLARGEKPVALIVEPSGAELAKPLRQGSPSTSAKTLPHPDPEKKLPRDELEIVSLSTTIVPHTKHPHRAVRVHLTLTPSPAHLASWNDEAGLSTLFVTPPSGWVADQPVLVLAPSPAAANPGTAPRRIEFDLRRDKEVANPKATPDQLAFEIFSHLCHGPAKVCQFLRKDVAVPLDLEVPALETTPK